MCSQGWSPCTLGLGGLLPPVGQGPVPPITLSESLLREHYGGLVHLSDMPYYTSPLAGLVTEPVS